jgi:acyl carrier protein
LALDSRRYQAFELGMQQGSAFVSEITHFLNDVVLSRDHIVDCDTDLLAEGLLDSLGVMQLVAFFEERWGVRVESDQIAPGNFRSVSAMAKFLQRQLRA